MYCKEADDTEHEWWEQSPIKVCALCGEIRTEVEKVVRDSSGTHIQQRELILRKGKKGGAPEVSSYY